MSKIKTLIFILIIIMLIVGGIKLIKTRKEQLAKEKTPQRPVYIVEAVYPKQGSITQKNEFLGYLEPIKEQLIVAKKPALVEKIYVKISDKVKKGQLLVKLDSTNIKTKIHSVNLEIENLKSRIASLEKKLDAVKTDVQVKENIYKRNLKLYKNDAISKETLEKSLVSLKLAQANLNQIQTSILQTKNKIKELQENLVSLQNELKYFNIKAAEDGTVKDIFVREGNVASLGKPILSIIGNKYQIKVGLPEDFPFKKNSLVYLNYNSQRLPLKIESFYPYSNKNLKILRTVLDKKPASIPINSYQKVVIEYKVSGTILPLNAVFSLSNGDYILVYQNNAFKKIPVKVVGKNEKYVVISQKLNKIPVVVADESKLRLLSFGAKGKIIIRGNEE